VSTFPLLDYAETQKIQAIAQVEAASQSFCDEAYKTLERVARERREFSSLDVWNAYDGPEPNHPRAIGAVFARAAKAGIIERTGKRVKSGRGSDHNQELALWKSRISN
jgi:hypothetical protein